MSTVESMEVIGTEINIKTEIGTNCYYSALLPGCMEEAEILTLESVTNIKVENEEELYLPSLYDGMAVTVIAPSADSVTWEGYEDKDPLLDTFLGDPRSVQKTENRRSSRVKPKPTKISHEYVCEICKIVFNFSYTLKAHKKREHEGEDGFECEKCGKKFTKLQNLVAHNVVHSGEKKYNCGTCGITFATSSTLNQHKIHHLNLPSKFKCELCDKDFILKRMLRKHNKACHSSEKSKTFECDTCGKTFRQKYSLTRHKFTHTGEKPYECDWCGFRCRTLGNLNIHKNTHTGERGFACETCGQNFATTSKLNEHIEQYSRQTSYNCKICGKGFHYLKNLNQHNRVQHTGEK